MTWAWRLTCRMLARLRRSRRSNCRTRRRFSARMRRRAIAPPVGRGGESVLFVDAEVAHVEAMRSRGLPIRGFSETFTVRVDAVTPSELGSEPLQTVLLAVKAPATEVAVASFAERLSGDGCVVSL